MKNGISYIIYHRAAYGGANQKSKIQPIGPLEQSKWRIPARRETILQNKANFETAPKPAPSTAFRASSELVEVSKDTQSKTLRNF